MEDNLLNRVKDLDWFLKNKIFHYLEFNPCDKEELLNRQLRMSMPFWFKSPGLALPFIMIGNNFTDLRDIEPAKPFTIVYDIL
jgi:hypothetical protein